MTKLIVIIAVVLFVYAVLWAFRKRKKWLCGENGWAFKGYMDSILRETLGSKSERSYGTLSPYRGSTKGDFLVSLLFVSAAVMKADKEVSMSEVDYMKKYFLSLFGRKESEEFIKILRIMLDKKLDVESVSSQIGQKMSYPTKLQLLHVLFGIASVDGQYHASEIDILVKIAGYLGVSNTDFIFICDIFVKPIIGAYEILEILPDATNEEVKKNYQRLNDEYNPNRVSHLGEDVHKAATLKTTVIKAAYEKIKQQREKEGRITF